MNKQALTHPTFQMKIHVAMFAAMRSSKRGNGGQVYIQNAAGNPCLRVKHTRGNGGGFSFHKNNTDLSKLVIDSLRA